MANNWCTYNGKVIFFNGKSISNSSKPVLPDNTVRIKYQAGYTPTMGDTQTLIDADENIWDIYTASNDWSGLFYVKSNLLEVIGANTSSVTDMRYMFQNCTSLTSVPLFDTSKAKDTRYMFRECTSLTSVPLFDTSSVTDMRDMFDGCFNVESGALALYQQASSQATPPLLYDLCFRNCGRDTTTGAAELAQIPSDWK